MPRVARACAGAPSTDSASDVDLVAIQIADVAGHVGGEHRGPVGGRVRVELVDIEVGVTTDRARRRREAREGRPIDEEPCVRDLDDKWSLLGKRLDHRGTARASTPSHRIPNTVGCLHAGWLLFLAFLPGIPAVLAAGCSSEPEPGSASVGPEDAAAPSDGGPRADGALSDGAVPDAHDDGGGGPVGQLFGFVGSSDGQGARVHRRRNGRLDAREGIERRPEPLVPRVRSRAAAGGVGSTRRRAASCGSFAFEPATGALTELSSKASGGAGPAHLSIDPTGTYVMVANYTGGTMSILPIDPAGMIGSAADAKTSGAMSHWAGTNPSGTHVFVPALGANVVAQYVLNAATGKLTDNGTAALPAGAGPRHLAISSEREVGLRRERDRDHGDDVRLRQGERKAHRQADHLGAAARTEHDGRERRGRSSCIPPASTSTRRRAASTRSCSSR